MSVKSALIAARALIADPAKWTKGSYVDKKGCMCGIGAVRHVTVQQFSIAEMHLDEMVKQTTDRRFTVFEQFTDDELSRKLDTWRSHGHEIITVQHVMESREDPTKTLWVVITYG